MTPLTVLPGSKEAGTGAPIQSNSSDVWAAITLDGTGLQVSFESSGKNYPVSGCYADYTCPAGCQHWAGRLCVCPHGRRLRRGCEYNGLFPL